MESEGRVEQVALYLGRESSVIMRDETVGIVGYGALGKHMDTLARVLGMHILVAERKGMTPRSGRVSFGNTLQSSTVLILRLPRTSESINSISTPALQIMPRGWSQGQLWMSMPYNLREETPPLC